MLGTVFLIRIFFVNTKFKWSAIKMKVCDFVRTASESLKELLANALVCEITNF